MKTHRPFVYLSKSGVPEPAEQRDGQLERTKRMIDAAFVKWCHENGLDPQHR